MAWVCVRCEQKIYAPRRDAVRFAVVWKYVKTRNHLTADIKNLKEIKDKAVITHITCDIQDTPGFRDRMKQALRIPEERDHPLLM